jgi:hypothetical protein
VTTLAVAVGLTIDTSATLVRVSVSAAGDRPPSYANAALHATRRVFGCFPPASPDWLLRPGKQKTPRRALGKPAYLLTKIGAGEGIRTLDPNLGKVRNRSSPIFWGCRPCRNCGASRLHPPHRSAGSFTDTLVSTICHHFMNCFRHFVGRRNEHSVEVVDITTCDRSC